MILAKTKRIVVPEFPETIELDDEITNALEVVIWFGDILKNNKKVYLGNQDLNANNGVPYDGGSYKIFSVQHTQKNGVHPNLIRFGSNDPNQILRVEIWTEER